MSQRHNQEVLEPGDKNYKKKEDFENQQVNINKKGHLRVFNCGCFPLSLGCFGIIIVIIAIFHFLSYLFSLLF